MAKKLFKLISIEDSMTDRPFISDMKKIRERAKKHMQKGAITEGYMGDPGHVITLLNEVLATEIICNLRYKNHYFLASGIHSESVAKEFLQHAQDEQEHANKVSKRIVQLNGKPNWNPHGLQSRAHAEYVEGENLIQMLEENLIAERIAIDTYREMIIYIGEKDPTTRRILEEILAQEEEHADDLANLLCNFEHV
jgi:bacterioferritin